MVDQAMLPMEKVAHKADAPDATAKLLADVDKSVVSYERAVSQTMKSLNERNFEAKMALSPTETALLSKIEESLVRGNVRGLQDIVGKYKDDPDSLTKVMKVVQDDLGQSKVKCGWKVDTEGGKKFGSFEVASAEQSIAFRTDKPEPVIAHDGRRWFEKNWDVIKDAAKDSAVESLTPGGLYVHVARSSKEMRCAEAVLDDVAWSLRQQKK